TGGGDVAVRLGQGQLCAGARVELRVAAVRVGRDGHAAPGGLVDPQHTGVVGHREGGVPADVPVVLVGDPALRGEVGGGDEGAQRGRELLGALVAGQHLGGVRLQGVLPVGPGVGAVVDGGVDGDGGRVDVHDAVPVVVDGEPAVAGDLADHGGLDVPLRGDGLELGELLGAHHRHHALLGLAHEDLTGVEAGIAQQHLLEVDVHAGAAVGGELAGRAGDAGRAEVLDRRHGAGRVQLEAALDEHLLHEGVAHLDAGAFDGAVLLEC